jgi:hypothetical protein
MILTALAGQRHSGRSQIKKPRVILSEFFSTISYTLSMAMMMVQMKKN